MKITLGFSPCPNDTFIFDALVNGKIDTGLDLDIVLADVQELNERAKRGELDCTKISYGAYPVLAETYKILDSGSALGKGVGPLVISRSNDINVADEDLTVAIPGENTTAHLLFSMAFPAMQNKVFVRYDEVEDFVLAGKGIGVIIHENRFTYASKGLHKIIDLGEFWEQKMNIEIPLGGIVVKRSLEISLARKLSILIRQSLEYSRFNYPLLSDFVRQNAQEMSEEVMRKHIDLYVNEKSISLGKEGQDAILKMLQYAGVQGRGVQDIFVS